jgi:hypothetical protein
MFTFDSIYEQLKAGRCRVTFTKVDGTDRTMNCTLKDEMLPEQYRGKGTILTEGSNVIRVYDLDLNEWRSFRVDSVKNVSYAGSGSTSRMMLNG